MTHTSKAEKGKRRPSVGRTLAIKRPTSKASSLLAAVVEFYLGSSDFNGMPAPLLAAHQGPGWRHVVRRLVKAGRLEVLTANIALNPHIKRLPAPPVEDQLRALDDTDEVAHVCVYPHPSELAERVERSIYDGKPFELALALGAPQLGHRGFDPKVLETYRADPRYTYECDDLHGMISISDEHYRSESVAARDKVLLQTFGFGYDEQFGRAVVTFNRYLADLTPEHQVIWAAHEVASEVRIHPDFYRTQIIGDFPKALPLCEAYFMELATINAMATAMGRSPLFRNVERPKRFGFLLRPTQHEFDQFVHLLDKTLSDNMNQGFFEHDVSFEKDVVRKDGKIQVERKGTLQVLEDWLRQKVRLPDSKPFDEMMVVLREVRKLRQAPAHALSDDSFDQEIFHKQRSLLIRAYQAVRTLRLILTNHPAARAVPVDPFLYSGEINTF
jgi:hypothetical protein